MSDQCTTKELTLFLQLLWIYSLPLIYDLCCSQIVILYRHSIKFLNATQPTLVSIILDQEDGRETPKIAWIWAFENPIEPIFSLILWVISETDIPLISPATCITAPQVRLLNNWSANKSATEFGTDSLHSKCILYCHSTGCITQIQYLQLPLYYKWWHLMEVTF